MLEEAPKTMQDVKEHLMHAYDEKHNRKKMVDTHSRSTFYIRTDLQKRLNRLAATKKRGFKTLFMNQAIEALLNELDPLDPEQEKQK